MSEGFKVTLPRPTAASRARARALLRRADRPCLFDRVEHAITILHVFPQNWPLARDFQRA